MLTNPGKYSQKLGQDLTLGCEFQAGVFNHFDNPVLWLKRQHHEECQVNIQRTINPPFADTGRFSVHFQPMHPVYRFELTIRGKQIPDCIQIPSPGPWFKMSSCQDRKSHCGDKTVVRSSYLHNGISFTGKMIYLYWIRPQSRALLSNTFSMYKDCHCHCDASYGTNWNTGQMASLY